MGENNILDEVCERRAHKIPDGVGERGEVDIVEDHIREETSKSAKGEYGEPNRGGSSIVNGQSRRIHAEFSPSPRANEFKPRPP